MIFPPLISDQRRFFLCGCSPAFSFIEQLISGFKAFRNHEKIILHHRTTSFCLITVVWMDSESGHRD